jgi:hypothetical protein
MSEGFVWFHNHSHNSSVSVLPCSTTNPPSTQTTTPTCTSFAALYSKSSVGPKRLATRCSGPSPMHTNEAERMQIAARLRSLGGA